jgi:hypothetical protein
MTSCNKEQYTVEKAKSRINNPAAELGLSVRLNLTHRMKNLTTKAHQGARRKEEWLENDSPPIILRKYSG